MKLVKTVGIVPANWFDPINSSVNIVSVLSWRGIVDVNELLFTRSALSCRKSPEHQQQTHSMACDEEGNFPQSEVFVGSEGVDKTTQISQYRAASAMHPTEC